MSEQKAGRELDALIGEKIMGATRERVSGKEWFEDRLYLNYNDMSKLRLFAIFPSDGPPKYGPDLPHYSTDIAAAWMVVEQLFKLGYRCTLRVMVDGYVVDVVRMDGSFHLSQVGVSFEEGMPLGICRAALEALTVGEGQ